MKSTDHHLFREDRTVLWQRIAEHIASHPQDLSIALDNIGRWEALGRSHPGPLIEWRDRIHEAQMSSSNLREFLTFLAEPNHDSHPIKSCSPFVGLPLGADSTPA